MKTKKVFSILALLCVVILVGLSVRCLLDARFWPFSTGTTDKAFLNTTFGMSPPEVRRSIAKYGGQLVTYEEYKRNNLSAVFNVFDFISIFSDDSRLNSSLFMPSLEMFDSMVEAEFDFREERLISVSVSFTPVGENKTESVVTSVETKLRNEYKFLNREDSKDVLGAYTLHFTSATAAPSLWVNLTDPKRPIIILTILNPKTQSNRQKQIQDREQKAF